MGRGSLSPSPATAEPLANGTAAVGTSARYAREDHVHPSAGGGAAVTPYTHTTAALASGASEVWVIPYAGTSGAILGGSVSVAHDGEEDLPGEVAVDIVDGDDLSVATLVGMGYGMGIEFEADVGTSVRLPLVEVSGVKLPMSVHFTPAGGTLRVRIANAGSFGTSGIFTVTMLVQDTTPS